MSIGPVSFFSSVASAQLAQGSADVDRAKQEGTTHARGADAQEKSEKAAGVGRTEEEHEAADRDADGRQPWEPSTHAAEAPAPSSAETLLPEPPHSKDPSGESGGTLDVSG